MPAIASTFRSDVVTLADELEALWQCLDELFAGLSPAGWSRKHGRHWTFADVPYHLAYFDRECMRVAGLGVDAPPSARWLMPSEAEILIWNARMFAERPAGQSVTESLAQMRASRDQIRALLAELTDADLDRPAWSPFFGWMTMRDGITGLIGHTYNHFMEARIRLKRSTPVPPPALIHRALGFYLGLMEQMVDPAHAAGRQFTAIMVLTGEGGGAWTIHVADGQCRVTEGHAAKADLVMAQSPEAFAATFSRITNPMLLMLTGKIKVKGYRGLATFGKLFPPPASDPDRSWPVRTELTIAPA